jgi:hypothetical protein
MTNLIGREIETINSVGTIGCVVAVELDGRHDWSILYERIDGTLASCHHEQIKLMSERADDAKSNESNA